MFYSNSLKRVLNYKKFIRRAIDFWTVSADYKPIEYNEVLFIYKDNL
ncbi:hypothetical protein SAMN02746098_00516 [Desulfosporosinus lacus DSM 15449]|uniref:Uncharacterized protein n=1 Tax=Desulfosporosinus lacus DSM 15449 TaxID=1121420 RepID=A0A1M5RCH8_9FIRM|nr:hypothetical protein SAMN02746098_00516 [Desulfosporosinus lacus DSM 15449]